MNPTISDPSKIGKLFRKEVTAGVLLAAFSFLSFVLLSSQSHSLKFFGFLTLAGALFFAILFVWLFLIFLSWKIEKKIFIKSVTPYKSGEKPAEGTASETKRSPSHEEGGKKHVVSMASLENGCQEAGA